MFSLDRARLSVRVCVIEKSVSTVSVAILAYFVFSFWGFITKSLLYPLVEIVQPYSVLTVHPEFNTSRVEFCSRSPITRLGGSLAKIAS